MKLALAVGKSRHYRMATILPRHFVQTAVKSGVPAAVVEEIFDEVQDTAETVANSVLKELPKDFPMPLAESIINGIRARLGLIAVVPA
jgi:serine/threonine-protein kinase HipA